MKLSIRTRFFLSVVAIVFLGIVAAGVYLSSAQRDIIYERAESNLIAHSKVAQALVAEVHLRQDVVRDDDLADRIGKMLGLRVTIVQPDGTVSGDSEVRHNQIAKMDNHGSRPEIEAAMKTGSSVSHRFSRTVGHEMIYAARVFDSNGVSCVVRVSRPLKEIDRALKVLYSTLLIAGLIIIGLSVLMSAFFSAYFSKVLRSMLEYAQSLADGKRRPREVDGPGELIGLTKSLESLSEQLEGSFSELAEERDRFGAVLEGMEEGVIALDGTKSVTVINSAALLLLGLSQEPLGRSLLETIRLPALARMIDGLAPGTADSAEFTLEREKARIVLARASRLLSGTFVIVLMDVTELRRLESMRRDFVSNVSHELRTPISVVRANAETLLDGALDDKGMALRFLESIVSNSERLTNLIGDLLDLTRIEEGRLDLQMEPVQLAQLYESIMRGFVTRTVQKNKHVTLEDPDNVYLTADRASLEQVVYNLLDNAVKYSGEGQNIVVRGRRVDGRVIIEVEDQGPGIPETHRERLFERFYRVDKGRSKELGGTGLGLAIVKHLATAMNGNAGMRPAGIVGSVFWVELPAADPDPDIIQGSLI